MTDSNQGTAWVKNFCHKGWSEALNVVSVSCITFAKRVFSPAFFLSDHGGYTFAPIRSAIEFLAGCCSLVVH